MLSLSAAQFGYSGAVLGVGTLLGSALSKMLIARNVSQLYLLWGSVLLLTAGAFGVHALLDSIWFLAPMTLVVMAFGIAIPNVLSVALIEYKQQAGSAGAVFGLMFT